MIPEKIGAIYIAQHSMDFMDRSVQSIQEQAGPIIVAVNTSLDVDPESSRALERLSTSGKIRIVQGGWRSRQELITALGRMLLSDGVSHAMLLDPHDVYTTAGIRAITAFVAEHPHVAQFQLRFHNYWKGLAYRVDPIDETYRTIILRLAKPARQGIHGTAADSRVRQIPEAVASGHQFTYASSREVVAARVRNLGVSPEMASRWMTEVWDAWDRHRCLRHLHPLLPERFRSTIRINSCTLPEALSGHPYLPYEIVAVETRPKPVLGLVVFCANETLPQVQESVNRICGTAPDNCEIVACTTARNREVIEFLRSKPGLTVVIVPEHAGPRDAWLEGGRAVSAKYLVFTNISVQCEGDWLEGLLAALERDPTKLYVPRVFHHDGLEPASRAQLFEARRGRYFGMRTRVPDFRFGQYPCWACSRETLACIAEKARDSAETRPVCCDYVEDTLVFAPGPKPEPKVEPAGNRSAIAASIVIPVYNNLHFTKACLESIFRYTGKGLYEVVVVDNGSTDGTREYLESLQPKVRYIRNRRNLFFAKGCNRGGWAAHGQNIVFLNNDTVVREGWLEELLAPLNKDSRIGIVGNKQLFPDSNRDCPGRIWHAGMVIGQDQHPWHVFYGFDPGHALVNQERDFAAVSGCCLLIRRPLFERLRGFDIAYQNGFEDVDLCLRARELGYRIVYAPRSQIVHFVSSTESRFDRDEANVRQFRTRWADRLEATEADFFREIGLRPAPDLRPPIRIGFISAFNQKRPTAGYAERLVAEFPYGSYVVLSEFGSEDRTVTPDPPQVLRAWNRGGQWYYPLLRYANSLDLDLIHVNFDSPLFPRTFLELLTALKNEGKALAVTIHETLNGPSIVHEVCQIADAVIVHSARHRTELIASGCNPSKIYVIESDFPRSSALVYGLYRELLKRSQKTEPSASASNAGQNAVTHVCWEGPQLVNHSLALVNRELEQALLESGSVDLSILPVGYDSFAARLNERSQRLASFYGLRRKQPVDVHVRHQWPPNWTAPHEGRWVLIQPWEYGSLPIEWIEQVNQNVDEVWAPSNFVRDVYTQSGVDPARVYVVPNGVDTNFFRPGLNKFNLPTTKSFKFLFVGGTIYRKGADILLDAFRRAFNSADDVVLVFKDFGTRDVYQGQGIGEAIRAMQKEPHSPGILYLDEDLSDREMAELYNACDCLVHPYRGEGFALPVLEAMSCGLPVIVTAGGPTDDFVDDDTGFRIPARKQFFGNRVIGELKTAGDLWLLEPDQTALEKTLIYVHENREHARQTGIRARAKAEKGWTWKHAAHRALERIEALRLAPIVRFLETADVAVLLDVDSKDWAGNIAATIESLEQNSYAKLKMFVRAASPSDEIKQLAGRAGLTILDGVDFATAIEHIRQKIRAPVLTLVRSPLCFSKQWLQQLVAIANLPGNENSVTSPMTSNEDSLHRAAFTLSAGDFSFQRYARAQWRSHRGQYQEIPGVAQDCALIHAGCLALACGCNSADQWLRRLQDHGLKTLSVKDTYVLRLITKFEEEPVATGIEN